MNIDQIAVEQGFYFINSSLYFSYDNEFKTSPHIQKDKIAKTEMRHRLIKDILGKLNKKTDTVARYILEAIQEYFLEQDKSHEERHNNAGWPGFIQSGIESMVKKELLTSLRDATASSNNSSKSAALRAKIFGQIEQESDPKIQSRLRELETFVKARVNQKLSIAG